MAFSKKNSKKRVHSYGTTYNHVSKIRFTPEWLMNELGKNFMLSFLYSTEEAMKLQIDKFNECMFQLECIVLMRSKYKEKLVKNGNT